MSTERAGSSPGDATGDHEPAPIERAVVFDGAQGSLYGVICRPHEPARATMLIVAGQPQTRVGSHRMFVDLARGLAARGVATLRFDIGGWGDSPGEARAFERSDRDIAAAARELSAAPESPPGVALWIWGLCDGASAAVLALPALRDAGIEPQGICMVNPWVRSATSHSDALVRTYYGRRLFSGEFWRRLLSGQVPLRHLLEPLRHLAGKGSAAIASRTEGAATDETTGSAPETDLPGRLLDALGAYRGRLVTVLSGNDLTAGETDSLIRRDRAWRKRLEREGELLRVPGADHGFSDPTQYRGLIERIAALAGPQV